MSNRTWRLLLGAFVTALLGAGVGLAGTAAADPITCPPGQTSVKTADGWTCLNGGGNLSNADEARNPND